MMDCDNGKRCVLMYYVDAAKYDFVAESACGCPRALLILDGQGPRATFMLYPYYAVLGTTTAGT